MPGSEAEWTGLFLFGVGVFGAYYHAIMRHWALWGIVPLDWFYLALMIAGALLLLVNSPLAPWTRTADGTQEGGPPLRRAALLVRAVVALVLLGTMIYLAIAR